MVTESDAVGPSTVPSVGVTSTVHLVPGVAEGVYGGSAGKHPIPIPIVD